MSDNVSVTREGAVVTVTLNRPDRRNSLSDAMLTDLGAVFAGLRDDASSRVVVVRSRSIPRSATRAGTEALTTTVAEPSRAR